MHASREWLDPSDRSASNPLSGYPSPRIPKIILRRPRPQGTRLTEAGRRSERLRLGHQANAIAVLFSVLAVPSHDAGLGLNRASTTARVAAGSAVKEVHLLQE